MGPKKGKKGGAGGGGGQGEEGARAGGHHTEHWVLGGRAGSRGAAPLTELPHSLAITAANVGTFVATENLIASRTAVHAEDGVEEEQRQSHKHHPTSNVLACTGFCLSVSVGTIYRTVLFKCSFYKDY